MKKDTDLHIRISPELKAELKAIADRLKTTMTKIVTPPIEKEVKKREKEVNKSNK